MLGFQENDFIFIVEAWRPDAADPYYNKRARMHRTNVNHVLGKWNVQWAH